MPGAAVLGAALKMPWDCPELVDGVNIEVAGGAAVDGDTKSEDCAGAEDCDCADCADVVSNIDLRFAGCSALVPDPRLPNNPPPEEFCDDPNMCGKESWLTSWLL
jgi:hypothetical protein